MPQTQQSGAAANDFGRETARRVANGIGATMDGGSTNEADFNGVPVVIKCAKLKTTSVGVTYRMQKDVQSVIGAFEGKDGMYRVLSLPIAAFVKAQRPTRSQGAAAGKVGIVSRTTFERIGTFIASISVVTPPPITSEYDIDIHSPGASEGNRRLILHLVRERNQGLVQRKKKFAASLACEACLFSFSQRYGTGAAAYCEVHHLVPLAEAGQSTRTKLQDLAILCANCHRVVHMRNPPYTLDEIKQMLAHAHKAG